jgi:hypothetical protein
VPGVNLPGGTRRADWYPDPTGRYEYRYYNGVSWTADVSRDGERTVDPAATSTSEAVRPPVTPGGPLLGPSGGAGGMRNGKATAALVLGIVALGLSWVPFLFVAGAVCGLLAIAYGVVARRATPRDPRGFDGVGIILGAAALVVCALGVFLTVRVVGEIDKFSNPPDYDVELTRCALDGTTLHVAGRLTNIDDRVGEFIVFVRTRVAGDSRMAVIDLDRVAAGETEAFARDLRLGRDAIATSETEPTCVVTNVTGPYPFGVEIAP